MMAKWQSQPSRVRTRRLKSHRLVLPNHRLPVQRRGDRTLPAPVIEQIIGHGSKPVENELSSCVSLAPSAPAAARTPRREQAASDERAHPSAGASRAVPSLHRAGGALTCGGRRVSLKKVGAGPDTRGRRHELGRANGGG